MKKTLIASVIGVALVAGSNVFAITIGDSGTANNKVGVYQNGSGGEFYVQPTSGPINNSGYSTLTKNLNGVGGGDFQTFCLETHEYLSSPVNYVVNSDAIAGGANDHGSIGNGGDTISVGTAWLYSQFALGNLANYFGSSRQANAGLLQNAIWALEDEIADPTKGANTFFDAAATHFGSAALAQVNYNPGDYGVWVLDMTINGTKAQDMLYYDTGKLVPDGGLTVTLLGLGLTGLALIRRKLA